MNSKFLEITASDGTKFHACLDNLTGTRKDDSGSMILMFGRQTVKTMDNYEKARLRLISAMQNSCHGLYNI